jgi:hypothetical protein
MRPNADQRFTTQVLLRRQAGLPDFRPPSWPPNGSLHSIPEHEDHSDSTPPISGKYCDEWQCSWQATTGGEPAQGEAGRAIPSAGGAGVDPALCCDRMQGSTVECSPVRATPTTQDR